MFLATKANQFRESLFGTRFDPKLRGTPDMERRVIRQWLVKADLTLFAHDRF